ncbi:arginine--tRNA ligase [Candidatus Woesearchaeota archaeon]|nr:arginine--tRNA ligase [Candidatus Woesearchaeota archaeon]
MGTREDIIELLKKETNLDDIPLEKPPKPELGDYAFPCFSLSKQLKKSPAEIAKELSAKLKKPKGIREIRAAGPYVNFFADEASLAESVLYKVMEQKDSYGSSGIGKGKKIVIEHTSINPNASPHVGRSRNAMIGDSIVRLYRFQGYGAEVHYFVNDVGKQIAMLVLGTKGKKKATFSGLLKAYVDINKKVEKSKELEKEVFELLSKLEKGDEETRKKFREIVSMCIEGQKKILADFGITHDIYDYESEYLFNKKTDKVLEQLEKTGKFFFDKDSRFVLDLAGFELGMKVPVMVLTRGDGTSLYALRDLAYTMDKMEKGNNIVVLGEDHKLYFDQLTAAMKLMEKPVPRAIFYSFVLLQEGKMSTRKGNVVLLEDFMKEAVAKARKEIEKRHEKCDEKDAKKIAYGAIKYSILRVSPEKNVTFDWGSALSFEGESCPYIQYAYARIMSIIRKLGPDESISGGKIDVSLLDKPEEAALVKKISEFTGTAMKAAEQLKPQLIANYAYELAKQFNEYYHSYSVIKEEKELKKARLLLAVAVAQAVKNALQLLGIDVLDRM